MDGEDNSRWRIGPANDRPCGCSMSWNAATHESDSRMLKEQIKAAKSANL